MNYYYCKVEPPLVFDSPEGPRGESDVMQAHFEFWTAQRDAGTVVAFGAVADPNGAFTVAILCLTPDVDPADIISEDPAIRSQAGYRYHVFPMAEVAALDRS